MDAYVNVRITVNGIKTISVNAINLKMFID